MVPVKPCLPRFKESSFLQMSCFQCVTDFFQMIFELAAATCEHFFEWITRETLLLSRICLQFAENPQQLATSYVPKRTWTNKTTGRFLSLEGAMTHIQGDDFVPAGRSSSAMRFSSVPAICAASVVRRSPADSNLCRSQKVKQSLKVVCVLACQSYVGFLLSAVWVYVQLAV